MKTIKSIFTLVLVALATTAFSQLSVIKEAFSQNHQNQVAFYTADYTNGNRWIENWNQDIYDAPILFRMACTENATHLYEANIAEYEIGIESWMVTPFESSVADEELNLELWMTSPFDSNVFEESPAIELWMTSPFEIDQIVKVEDWML